MRILPLLLSLPLAACLPAAPDHTPAAPVLVIRGHDAQKLQCAAMVMVLADHLAAHEVIGPRMLLQAQGTAVALLAPLPGAERDRVRALLQRMDRLRATRTPLELGREFERSAMWCAQVAEE